MAVAEQKRSITDLVGEAYKRFLSKRGGKRIKIKMAKEDVERKMDWAEGRGSAYTIIPPLESRDMEVVDVYPVNEPYAFLRVTYNNSNSEYLLEAIEPQLSETESRSLQILKDALQRTLDYEQRFLNKVERKEYLRRSIESFLSTRGYSASSMTKDKLSYYLIRDFIGYGPIDVFIRDPNSEDISCDGVNVPIYIFHRKYESIRTNVRFVDEQQLNSFVIYLGQKCGKQISVASPILDGTTPEGHRLQATYSKEVTSRGSSFTIRLFKEKPFTPVDLIDYGTASPEMVAYFWMSVENGESAMIIGGTGNGKTSTLNAISLFIPPSAKIVTMEDTREINLPHENWIPGTTRSGVGERGADGKAPGEIDMFDLVRAALRQRPNYIIVGEVRGKEAYTMFQAMATGHTTYATMHADSVKLMINRLENPPINIPRILLTALRIVIVQQQVRIGKEHTRRIRNVVELIGFEPETNEIITNSVFEWDQLKDEFYFKGHSVLFDKLKDIKNWTQDELEEEFARRVDIIRYMVQKNMNNHMEIWSLINRYYRDPEETAAMVRSKLEVAEKERIAVGN
ncbi:MAG: type II/IV secretion system ATPase subunit [Methanomassiliicoccales archaeon]